MSSRISILVVNFNGGELLIDALDRVFERRDEWHELILADNGSSDGSLLRARQRHPEVHTLELGANLGFGTANNRAAAEAEGEYLLLLNSDAWPEPGCLTRLREILDRRPEVAWASPRLRYPDGRPQFHWAPTTSVVGEAIQKLRNRHEHRPWIHGRGLRRVLGRGWFTAACALVRRSAFEQVGGFDEGFFLYFEDVDLCLRLRRAGFELADDPEARAVHVKGGSQNQEEPSLNLPYRLGQGRYYRKHRPRWEQRFLRWKVLRRAKDPEARVLLERVYSSEP